LVLVDTLKCVQGTGLAFWPRGRNHRAVGHEAVTERALPHVRRAQPQLVLLPPCAGTSPRFGPGVGRFSWLQPAPRCRVCAVSRRPAAMPHVGAGQSPRQPLRGHRGSRQLSIPPTVLAWRMLCCHVESVTWAQWRWDTSLPHPVPASGRR
jgi:hypothetical protein